ncbi:acetylcholine receptor subunit beta-like [Saccostrea echinata]|uniref:acetylcholine receptor subunit beta-like n=1 Tax=Saccostrea echinata TaxID=191078 RepID=UPI002A816854|nr:acetylcholine receptor subunit beta-like [Saccostrea echinata]
MTVNQGVTPVMSILPLPTVNNLYTADREDSLRSDLFTNYQKNSRPAPLVDIRCNMKLLSIKDLIWNDTRFDWSSNSMYTDIETIYSTETAVFTPPIVVENSVSNLGVISDTTLPIKISQTGETTWSPGDIYVTSCDIDTTFYPFDEQTCVITLTTRGYTANQITLSFDEVPIIRSAYQDNGEWIFVKSSTSTSLSYRGNEVFSQLNFIFTLKRRTTFHLLNTVLPMFLLASMVCFVFKLPVDSGEKLGYSLTVLLAIAVYLTLVADNIPTTSTYTSYLSVYLNVMLGIAVASSLLTIFVINIHFTPEEEEVSEYIQSLAKFGAQMVCWKHSCCRTTDKSTVDVLPYTDKIDLESVAVNNNCEFAWPEIAKILDAFFFRVYVLLMVILTTAFAVVMAMGSWY